MKEHYFTSVPESESRPFEFETECLGQRLVFVCDRGVFSKGEIDEGTRILLESLPPLSGRILDLGCGWGPVGITLGKLFPDAIVLMSDINQRAAALAGANIIKNGVSNVSVSVSDGFEGLEGSFDYIITNPPIRAGKQKIYSLFDDALKRLNPKGSLFIVIRRQQGAESALKHLGENARVIEKRKGFWVIEVKGE
ncbi:MAG: methyltransferase [Clostridiales bacterium]|nr:methyltransferase [Clostridiales bacterium]